MKRGPKSKLSNVIPTTGTVTSRGNGRSVAQAVAALRPKKCATILGTSGVASRGFGRAHG
jgi:hypothetical protein